MRIQLTTSLAGAEVLPAGSIIDTTEDEARRLVSAGFAVYVEKTPAPKAAPQKDEPEIEEATSKQFVKRETTASRSTRKSTRKRKK